VDSGAINADKHPVGYTRPCRIFGLAVKTRLKQKSHHYSKKQLRIITHDFISDSILLCLQAAALTDEIFPEFPAYFLVRLLPL